MCRSAPQCWTAAAAAAFAAAAATATTAAAAAAAELTHWQKFYYCMLLESDFVGTFFTTFNWSLPQALAFSAP